MAKCERCGAFMESAATACTWCGAGGDNGSAESFVVPTAPVAAPGTLAAATAAAGTAAPSLAGASPLPQQKNLQGIGGWLILVAIGLGIGPIGLLLALGASILLLLSPETHTLLAAHPGVAGMLLLNAAIDGLSIAALAALNFLFYRKNKTFPQWAIAFLAASLILDIAAYRMMLQYMPSFSPADAFGSLIAAAIWIPYFLLSQRVRQTFVN